MQVKSVVPTTGNSFRDSPFQHQPKFARPACTAKFAARRWANAGHPRDTHTRPACPPACPLDRSWPVTRREERPGSLGRRDAGRNRLPAASRHPRAGETLSPGARADAPGERRLRSTRPPRPGNIAHFGRDTVPGRTRGRGLPGLPAQAT